MSRSVRYNKHMNTNRAFDLITVDNATDMHWLRLQKLYPVLKAHGRPVVRFDARYTKCLGFCDSEAGIITLAYKYFPKNRDTMLNEVLPHELAHFADYCMIGWKEYEFSEGHGPNWQKIMLSLGLEPTLEIYVKR